MVFTTRQKAIPQLTVQIYSQALPQVLSHKHLGVVLHSHLSWSEHVSFVITKASKKIGLLRRLRQRLDPLVIHTFYQTCVRPTLEYSSLAFSGLAKTDSAPLERTQRVAAA